jgi:transposase
MGTRRKFTEDFKREAVRLVDQPGSTLLGVSTSLGIDRSVLKRWVDNTRQGRYEPKPGRPLKTDSQAELEAVKRELARVKMERDILKKALGYFAKDPT